MIDLNTKIKTCMNMLKARLYEHEIKKGQKTKNLESQNQIWLGTSN